jgi:hypothetical protein
MPALSSFTTIGSAFNLNPSVLSMLDGMTIEAVTWDRLPEVNLIYGKKGIGAGLAGIAPNNSFYGGPIIFDSDLTWGNLSRKDEFNNSRQSFSIAYFFQKYINLGFLLKVHPQLGTVNFGGGINLNHQNISIGFSYFQDSQSISDIYDDKFKVITGTAGIRLKLLSIDTTIVYYDTEIMNNSYAVIISSSLFYKFININAGLRIEQSTLTEINERIREQFLLACKIKLLKKLAIGLNYNYFLNKDLSVSLSYNN